MSEEWQKNRNKSVEDAGGGSLDDQLQDSDLVREKGRPRGD